MEEAGGPGGPLFRRGVAHLRRLFPPVRETQPGTPRAGARRSALPAAGRPERGARRRRRLLLAHPGGLYLEHLAVDPGLRNEKFGSRILERLASGGQPVVLEIEPPEDELTRRRCGFYRRNGFVANEHPYLHPSYSRPFEPHPLVLMSRPEPLTGAQAESFGKFVRETVLRYSDHGPVPEK